MKWKKMGLFVILMLLLAGCGSISQKDAAKEGESFAAEDMTASCSLLIECHTIKDHWDDLDQAKQEFVPEDGIIIDQQDVKFAPGEKVFDVLRRVCKEEEIQMESEYTPLYKSYYIKGIHNLYEFDCGAKSGWTYNVNGTFPNYGCSEYEVKDGDQIEWHYTCNLGSDVENSDYQETEEE